MKKYLIGLVVLVSVSSISCEKDNINEDDTVGVLEIEEHSPAPDPDRIIIQR